MDCSSRSMCTMIQACSIAIGHVPRPGFLPETTAPWRTLDATAYEGCGKDACMIVAKFDT
eukprot:366152-Chlamydomonas_euryale.AAC.6